MPLSLDAAVERGPAFAEAAAAAHLAFELSGQIFAVDVVGVREILDVQPVAALPNAPMELLGMIDVRGQGVAVVDLAARLGLGQGDRSEARILVFEVGPDAAPIAAFADRVLAVTEIAAGEIEPAPKTTTGWNGAALRGVVRLDGRIAMILDMEALLGSAASDPFAFE